MRTFFSRSTHGGRCGCSCRCRCRCGCGCGCRCGCRCRCRCGCRCGCGCGCNKRCSIGHCSTLRVHFHQHLKRLLIARRMELSARFLHQLHAAICSCCELHTRLSSAVLGNRELHLLLLAAQLRPQQVASAGFFPLLQLKRPFLCLFKLLANGTHLRGSILAHGLR